MNIGMDLQNILHVALAKNNALITINPLTGNMFIIFLICLQI